MHIDDTHISFKYKDYLNARLNDKVGQGNKQKVMRLTHEEFLRRFEQHILPKNFVHPDRNSDILDKINDLQFSYGIKIRHAGYLHARNKMERIAAVCKELKLPPPMQKVYIPVALMLLLQSGRDVMACLVCGQGRMKLAKTLINHHGVLMDIAQLRNRGSPKIKRKGCNR